ncbi:MAG: hypothetical protein WCL10_18675 [Novosphingobium sp.]|uniref:hypothetical protein n=1 Tax=Novosphingobium sp. TaxID=1874826 RepID=UPI0030194935
MTHRRQQVLQELAQAGMNGEQVTLARLARSCGLYDYREARRIMGDLKKLRAI